MKFEDAGDRPGALATIRMDLNDYEIVFNETNITVVGCDCEDDLDDPTKLVQLRDELNELLERRGLA